jgi:hypothetical protein
LNWQGVGQGWPGPPFIERSKNIPTIEAADAIAAEHEDEALAKMVAIEDLKMTSLCIGLDWLVRKPDEPQQEPEE